MRYLLYIDNFRGFSNEFVPIAEVNFLVGENSSGKTSVLGLLKLLSSAGFSSSQAFGDEHVDFGSFSDMVSVHSKNQSYFRVGSIWMSRNGKETPTANGSLLTYISHEGMPKLQIATLVAGNSQITVRFRAGQLLFKKQRIQAPISMDRMESTVFPKWIHEHRSKERGYTKLGFPREMARQNFPLVVLINMIQSITESDKKKESLPLRPTRIVPGGDLAWVAPIRSKPNRTYDALKLDFSPDGAHTPYLIRRILGSRKEAAKFKSYIARVGRLSGLFQSVKIKSFSRAANAPFEVDVVLDGKALNMKTVGYGVSQALPVLVELLARGDDAGFAIQQPEIHLHPRAQAAFGDVLFEMASSEDKHFLIETHSDFTIDRFRMNYRKKSAKRPEAQILFFERRNRRNTVTPIPISSKGELPSDQPESYRGFFIKEDIRLLGL